VTALRLKDKALLVTGAGRGIGRDIATAATREGAAVTVADRDAEGATSAVAQIRAAGGRRCRRCCHTGRL
jgi:3-oxoacyl-[acyl-carrier protein] reductase